MLAELNNEQMKLLTTHMGTIVNQMPEIKELKDFSFDSRGNFLYHYERFNEYQRASIELIQKKYALSLLNNG
eukprot:snap_masked-scaffold_11-processed-gene-10.27-mRNA-1 protein AED:1.00 eAED:1.00 QI:0/-1/0/0/-1/1/1/0/71